MARSSTPLLPPLPSLVHPKRRKRAELGGKEGMIERNVPSLVVIAVAFLVRGGMVFLIKNGVLRPCGCAVLLLFLSLDQVAGQKEKKVSR